MHEELAVDGDNFFRIRNHKFLKIFLKTGLEIALDSPIFQLYWQ